MGLFNFSHDIGVDLGTASILIYVKDKGIVLNEPSVVALDQKDGKIIAIGESARRMLGRTPGNILAVRPLREGVIADYEITEKMLRYFIHKACGSNLLFKPIIMVCIPSGVTGVEERAVRQAAYQSGAKHAYLMEEPLAAALGAGLDIHSPAGNMVVDIGGGTTDIAVLSLGGIVCSKSLRVGGDKFDEAIVRYIRRINNLLIGERFAEDLKITVGTAYPNGLRENKIMEVRGRDLLTGLPKSISFSALESYEAMAEPLEAIVAALKEVLEITPPELAADIIDRGIMMTGGGALLEGLDSMLSQAAGLPVYIAEDPISCVARGTGLALADLRDLRNSKSFVRQAL
ncbi:MAG: rod shape-determining protein MreB [Clostridiales bacterium]|jgi:rod shape-determining protein MreB|nr:rod shape-determining protein MreB [Clostridiales bacterium]MDR2713527.1 rod shape-determining protein MreB [Clostridiales bacterium]